MHERFLGYTSAQNTENKAPASYRIEQSQLTKIFQTKYFNCISSSMLYILLAKKAGMHTQGVVLPSHAFVQLEFPDGQVVEVETTSLQGYDLIHDSEFYISSARSWYSDRVLEDPTYADYLARQIVSPYQLGLQNMSHQHTNEDRMPYADRMRLAELRAIQLPQDVKAQKHRLYYYQREFEYLNNQQNYATAARINGKIELYISHMVEQAAQTSDEIVGDNFAETEFIQLLV